MNDTTATAKYLLREMRNAIALIDGGQPHLAANILLLAKANALVELGLEEEPYQYRVGDMVISQRNSKVYRISELDGEGNAFLTMPEGNDDFKQVISLTELRPIFSLPNTDNNNQND